MITTERPPGEKLGQAILGCLFGTAVGDALGLPMEGLSRQRAARIYHDLNRFHLLANRGMVSDDTQHTIMVAQAVIVSGGDPATFTRALARQMRLWLLEVPAGVGLATLRAIVKLWLGFGPERSGVFSAGNGPAMRSAILGVCCADDPARRRELVRRSTRLTHTDPKAEWGAQAVALAAALASGGAFVKPNDFLFVLESELGSEAAEFLGLVRRAVRSAAEGESTQVFAASLGLGHGVGGYVFETVPVVLQPWLRHQGYWLAGVQDIIRCGGDTDTTAAIVGALIGAGVGPAGIPAYLRERLWERPHSAAWIQTLGCRLAASVSADCPSAMLPAHGEFARNLLFLLVVLAHGLRRLLPPY